MSLFAPQSLGPIAREKMIDAHNEYLRGSSNATLQLLTESTENLESLRATLSVTVKPSTDSYTRTAATFEVALCRDALSSFATRGTILARGARARNMELHMGATLGLFYSREK